MVSSRLPPTLAEKLLYVAVVAVPFQQAFTVNIGFPLKISEVAVGLALAVLFLQWRAPKSRMTGQGLIGILLLIVLISTGFHLLLPIPGPSGPAYPQGLTFDIIQYCAYGVVVIAAAWAAATRLGPEWISRALAIAVRLAALYSLLQLTLRLAGVDAALTAVNGASQIGTLYGIDLTRNGPFLEGNYLGFFAGVSLFICLKRKDTLGVVASLFCLFYSQSTTGLVGLVVALLVISLTRPSSVIAVILSTLGLVAVFAVAFIPTVNEFVTRQLAKLGLVDASQFSANINYSRRSRTVNTETGFTMGTENPLLGVGPGRYGYWYDEYTDFTGLPANFNSNIIRPIANNSFAQIYAELGAIAFIVIVLLFLAVLWKLRRAHFADLAMVVFVIVGMNATPAWTVLPIWFAIAYLTTVRPDSNKPGKHSPRHAARKTPPRSREMPSL